MGFDITKLSEDELLELNRRVVERLQFIRSAKSLTQLARFSVGMAVEFDTDDGRTISGTVARLNQKTATVVSAGDDMVRGELIHDPEHGWIGQVDWSTQDVWESYPPAVAARG